MYKEKENKESKNLRNETQASAEETWASDAQDELEDWIEEQGIQLRY